MRLKQMFPSGAFETLLLSLLFSPPALLAARAPFRAASPEYGLSTFIYDRVATTNRDLGKVQALGFGWVNLLFRWTDLDSTSRSG